jgi:hypothetical protein
LGKRGSHSVPFEMKILESRNLESTLRIRAISAVRDLKIASY